MFEKSIVTSFLTNNYIPPFHRKCGICRVNKLLELQSIIESYCHEG